MSYRLQVGVAFFAWGSAAVTSTAADYLRGFTWDWRVDFGRPSALSELPPNPQSDAASRGLPSNAGLSSGPQAGSVWQYGNASYAALTEGTFAVSDFHRYTAMSQYVTGEFLWDEGEGQHRDRIAYNAVEDRHKVHPDSDSESEAAVIRWTYPGQQTVDLRITGTVADLAPGTGGGCDGVDLYLLKNASADTIAYAVIPNAGSCPVNATTTVAPGDEVFMGLGYLGNHTSDNTAVDVTFEVVPEPVSAALLAAGGLLLLRRKPARCPTC